MTRPRAHITRALQYARIAAGLDQVDVAARLHVGRTTIFSWESGERNPGLAALEEWAAVLGYEIRLVPASTSTEPA